MTEIDFLPVGDSGDSGDAIAMRFNDPQSGAPTVVTIDAGFQDDGEALVAHVRDYYDTDVVDLAILTHPDGDHIGGMGELVRGLDVRRLWLHNIGAHGGSSLPAADAVNELIDLALSRGARVEEPWTGDQAFGGAITILGPDREYYEMLVREQVGVGVPVPAGRASLLEVARGVYERFATALPVEVPFAEKEVTPRNNSSAITVLSVDGKRHLFTADAGVPALDRAWDAAERLGIGGPPDFCQLPHHGSRRNASSTWLDRLLGPIGQPEDRTAFVSAVANSTKHPSGRVVNAYKRRGCKVVATAGKAICHGQWSHRPGWGPVEGLPPMDESEDD